jgi:mono/diheme cytochrome c family protein
VPLLACQLVPLLCTIVQHVFTPAARAGFRPMNNIVSFVSRYWLFAILLVPAGCGRTAPPEFRLNMVTMAEMQIPAEQQQQIANILDAMFGTPDQPFVLPETGLDIAKLRLAAGPVKSDQFGRETGLYRRHCAHCHGTTGDGLGPTALVLDPYPRDYRPAKFKFKSTERAAMPTDLDLETVVRHGVQGTAMPSFALLPDPQIKALVEYVKYLSMRGQAEIFLANAVADLSEGEKLAATRELLVDEILTPIVERWKTAADQIIPSDGENARPDVPLAESIAKGRELFYGTKGNCAKCHGWSALGDGQTNDYDDWSKVIVDAQNNLNSSIFTLDSSTEMSAEERAALAQQVKLLASALASDSLPPRHAIPRNLRQGIYRGGRAPVDIFYRIYAGINGMPMPAVGPPSPGAPGTLTPAEIWHLVDYVMSLPYEPISQPPRQQRAVSRAAL